MKIKSAIRSDDREPFGEMPHPSRRCGLVIAVALELPIHEPALNQWEDQFLTGGSAGVGDTMAPTH